MPTTRGWLVAVTGALLLTAGTLSQYQELVLLGALAVLAVAVAALFVGRPAAVTMTRSLPGGTRTTPGRSVRVHMSARNTGRRGLRISERVVGPDGEHDVPLTPLPGGGTGGSDYWLQPRRRGLIELGPLRAGRSDPLGLARSTRDHGTTDHVWVHPTWQYLRAIPVGNVADPDGEVDGARAGTLTFHTLRDYAPGDDLRHVHWRSSARLDRLVVREYVDTSQTRVCVIVDDRAAPEDAARLDEVAGAAASLLATGVRASLHCELRLVSGRGRDSGGGLPSLLDLLAEAAPTRGPDLADALHLARTQSQGDTAILVSAGLDATDLRLFGQLADRYSGLIAVVVGQQEPPTSPDSVTLIAAGDAGSFADRWNEAPWAR
ncbi:DUF58 domain-containing protein [Nocardiopsis sp. L17-MgMaSL7]|uniref:DUF58 domain-containing protein n=1 Tax=Nocardiopsis sp. L17-MgMaSL7 TaxID=1938893 RepID=UPI000D70F942|nr:DUF58 domain-containing protein [Nocardiopsis sp. L17-MgMaSL7]PWV47212.1 uncharacterized protein (DUF58 family) [Nocardiopsis sp. L17-MgMaSL7]